MAFEEPALGMDGRRAAIDSSGYSPVLQSEIVWETASAADQGPLPPPLPIANGQSRLPAPAAEPSDRTHDLGAGYDVATGAPFVGSAEHLPSPEATPIQASTWHGARPNLAPGHGQADISVPGVASGQPAMAHLPPMPRLSSSDAAHDGRELASDRPHSLPADLARASQFSSHQPPLEAPTGLFRGPHAFVAAGSPPEGPGSHRSNLSRSTSAEPNEVPTEPGGRKDSEV